MKALKILAAVVSAVILTACGTNEENYRKAYEKAKSTDTGGVENTIYNRIRQQAEVERYEIDGDTVTVIREYVSPAKSAGFKEQQMKRYNVVVGRFKQLFHAKSLCSRMAAGGYPDAIIIETAEPLYYVVALSSPTIRPAISAADTLRITSPVKLAPDFPFILRAPNR